MDLESGMSTESLVELYEQHRGKTSDKWTNYLPAYQAHFDPLRKTAVSVLEIGVQNGGSLEIWAKYFPEAKHILGCDIDERCRALVFDDPRVNLIVGDATSEPIRRKLIEISGPLDIVIDDGSHRSEDIVRTFSQYFPYLRDGGVYVAEDLHASYWQAYEGGVFHPYSSISFFKKLCDIINHEHWAVEANRISLLEGFRTQYGVEFDELELARIHSITFVNSVCFIKKAHPLANVLGKRVIVGIEELITKRADILSKGPSSGPSEAGNEWSQLAELPEVVASNREAEVHKLAAQLDAAQVRQLAAEGALTCEKNYHDGLQTVISELRLEKRDLERRLHSAQHEAAAQRARVSEIEGTQAWRYTRVLSRVKALIAGGVPRG